VILATRGGNHEFSAPDPFLTAGTPIPSPANNSAAIWSGKAVTLSAAQGLTAAMAAVRLLAETTATLPLLTYREDSAGQRVRARDVPQWRMLRRAINPLSTPFDVKAYIIASLQWYGNAYLWKDKSRRQGLKALWPLPAKNVRPRITRTTLTYDVRTGPAAGDITTVGPDRIIHIRGLLTDSPYIGVSPVSAHSQAFGTALAAEEYAARYFANDAAPGGLIIPDQQGTPQQRQEFRESWEGRHRGAGGAHKLGILPFKGTYAQIGVSARDAQLIEVRQYSIADIARVFRVPPGMLTMVMETSTGNLPPPEQESMRFLTYGLSPWLVRAEEALNADRDLFPDEELGCGFWLDAMLRADQPTRYASYLPARQAGWLTANEIRAKEGEPPLPGGDELQATPVGGAPNESAGPAGPDDEPVDGD